MDPRVEVLENLLDRVRRNGLRTQAIRTESAEPSAVTASAPSSAGLRSPSNPPAVFDRTADAAPVFTPAVTAQSAAEETVIDVSPLPVAVVAKAPSVVPAPAEESEVVVIEEDEVHASSSRTAPPPAAEALGASSDAVEVEAPISSRREPTRESPPESGPLAAPTPSDRPSGKHIATHRDEISEDISVATHIAAASGPATLEPSLAREARAAVVPTSGESPSVMPATFGELLRASLSL
jgi:hypothetical protein